MVWLAALAEAIQKCTARANHLFFISMSGWLCMCLHVCRLCLHVCMYASMPDVCLCVNVCLYMPFQSLTKRRGDGIHIRTISVADYTDRRNLSRSWSWSYSRVPVREVSMILAIMLRPWHWFYTPLPLGNSFQMQRLFQKPLFTWKRIN